MPVPLIDQGVPDCGQEVILKAISSELHDLRALDYKAGHFEHGLRDIRYCFRHCRW
jgi:hypothetical protein